MEKCKQHKHMDLVSCKSRVSDFKMPNAIGDTFYYLTGDHIAIDTIMSIKPKFVYAVICEIQYCGARHTFVRSDINHTVFFSYEAAVRAYCDSRDPACHLTPQASRCSPSQLQPGELAIINAYTTREVSEDDVYVFSMVLCDNDIDKDNERFTSQALLTLSNLLVGQTGIVDDVIRSKQLSPRIFTCDVERVDGETNSIGHTLYQLVARAYILKVPETAAIRDAIATGKITKVSIGCSTDPAICSICGRELQMCTHVPGRQYGLHMCHGEIHTPREAYEFAFVAPHSYVGESDG